jgi:hypothetical protein
MLDDIGFSWNGNKDHWMNRYNELVEFRNKTGHCNVPCKYEANKVLGYWVSTQRYSFKKGRLSKECIAKLNKIGFAWSVCERG